MQCLEKAHLMSALTFFRTVPIPSSIILPRTPCGFIKHWSSGIFSHFDIFIKLWNSNRNNNPIPLKWPSWLISSSFLFFLEEWQSCWSVSGVEACHSSVKLSSTEIDGSSHKSWSWCSCRSRFIKYCSKTVPTLTCCKWSIGCAWASLICVHKPTEMSLCVCAFSCALTKCQTQLVWKELVVTQSTSAE